MAKGTIIFFFILSALAFLLLGINIGKKIPSLNKNEKAKTNDLVTPSIHPSLAPTSTPAISSHESSSSATVKKTANSITTYKDNTCGFQISYPGSFISTKTSDNQSVILTNPDDKNEALAAACAKSIPRPPVSSEKIESTLLDGAPATLYHDQYEDGNPRDEVIVKNPRNGMEIIIAGYGQSFQQAIVSFKFL